MAYIPNSLERCTEILGYDPQAYLSGEPSHLNIPKYQIPKNIQNGPQKDTYKKNNNPEKSTADDPFEIKKGWKMFGIFLLSITGITAGTLLCKKLKGKPKTIKTEAIQQNLKVGAKEQLIKTKNSIAEFFKNLFKSKTKES